METKQFYDNWATRYDSDSNRTRDLEKMAFQSCIATMEFSRILEIGCGTGKNTEWLKERASRVVSVDFSAEMLKIAREKIRDPRVEFHQADITEAWNFVKEPFGLVSFSLVLEHIPELDFVFRQAADALTDGGYLYLGELHPYKQFSGSSARFATTEGTHSLPTHVHHITDFTRTAIANGLRLVEIGEYFDDGDRSSLPRILTLLFCKVQTRS